MLQVIHNLLPLWIAGAIVGSSYIIVRCFFAGSSVAVKKEEQLGK